MATPHEDKLLEDHVVQLLLRDERLSDACMDYAKIMGCDVSDPEDEAEQDLLATFQFEFLRNICNRALND